MSVFKLEFPDVAGLSQDTEWCHLTVGDGPRETLRFHDYARIYETPGLYEELFYGRLQCCSPKVTRELLASALSSEATSPGTLRGLDLGAGNGMVGEELRLLGVPMLVGVDIIEAARNATMRDRPKVYADYVVADVTSLDEAARSRLASFSPNLLTCVAALGFGDIPSKAFATAWAMLETPGWVAFNIKEAFLSSKYDYGFSLLVKRLVESGLLEVKAQRSYVHRLGLDGSPLRYVGFVGIKRGPIPSAWWAQLD
ncbi:MAG: hypothetical protein ACO1OB_33130 [Archangium sp.]